MIFFILFSESISSQREEKPSLESLDLSRKRFEAAPPSPRPPIPLINIIKAEPADLAEGDPEALSTAISLSRPAPFEEIDAPKVKVEPVEVPSVATTSRAPPPAVPRFFFPSLPPPLQLSSNYQHHHHHLQQLLGKMEPHGASEEQHQQQLEEDSQQLVFNSSMFIQQPHHPSSYQQQPQLEEQPAASSASGGGAPRKKSAAKPQQAAYTCQKCGKSYNWNYNLNRHMRFECGIENKFECAVCRKRFPYKQNAAIHLKRKHKLMMENADDMLAAGHIVLMHGQPS